jgi:hypothetical protein
MRNKEAGDRFDEKTSEWTLGTWETAPVCLLGALHTEEESKELGRNAIGITTLAALPGMCRAADLLVEVTEVKPSTYYMEEPTCADKLDALLSWNDHQPRTTGKKVVLGTLRKALRKLEKTEASVTVKPKPRKK